MKWLCQEKRETAMTIRNTVNIEELWKSDGSFVEPTMQHITTFTYCVCISWNHLICVLKKDLQINHNYDYQTKIKINNYLTKLSCTQPKIKL